MQQAEARRCCGGDPGKVAQTRGKVLKAPAERGRGGAGPAHGVVPGFIREHGSVSG